MNGATPRGPIISISSSLPPKMKPERQAPCQVARLLGEALDAVAGQELQRHRAGGERQQERRQQMRTAVEREHGGEVVQRRVEIGAAEEHRRRA